MSALAHKVILSIILVLITNQLIVKSVSAAVILNEFSSKSSTEWVELLNTDADNSVNLSGYTLKNGSGTILKTLSGTLPRQGMLTFDFSPSTLNDDGDCLVLWDNIGSAIYSMHYGSGSCGGGGQNLSQAPEATQSGTLISGNWSVDDTPSKGWCNDNTGGCPTIASITAQMDTEGVSTNLGSQSDYTRTSGLYFEKTGYGRITFLSELNFTDRDALSWMSQLDSKLDINTKARISLDADLIKNFVDTQAQLTMYGLTLSNPKIQVDGLDDTGGVTSGMSYANGTLTFTAAHFTTFTAVENSSSSSNSSSSTSNPGAPVCTNQVPSKPPKLFQINTTKNSAKLFFVPSGDPVTYYYIAYGLKEGDERYGATFLQGSSTGVLSYTINLLKPNTKYYFKIRGGNGCMPGPWSSYLNAKTKNSVVSNSTTSTIKVKGVKTVETSPRITTPENLINVVTNFFGQLLNR